MKRTKTYILIVILVLFEIFLIAEFTGKGPVYNYWYNQKQTDRILAEEAARQQQLEEKAEQEAELKQIEENGKAEEKAKRKAAVAYEGITQKCDALDEIHARDAATAEAKKSNSENNTANNTGLPETAIVEAVPVENTVTEVIEEPVEIITVYHFADQTGDDDIMRGWIYDTALYYRLKDAGCYRDSMGYWHHADDSLIYEAEFR